MKERRADDKLPLSTRYYIGTEKINFDVAYINNSMPQNYIGTEKINFDV